MGQKWDLRTGLRFKSDLFTTLLKQAKLVEEVDGVVEAAGGGHPDYTALVEMEYMEMCILETLRLRNKHLH